MVGIRIRERGSYQDSANAYANRYGYGSLYIYGPWGLDISVNQEVIQASKVTGLPATFASEIWCMAMPNEKMKSQPASYQVVP
jgi:hypothetical protein